MSTNWGWVSVSLRVVERSPWVRIVVAWRRIVVVILWIELTIHLFAILLVLDLLVDHLLVPHLLMAHLLAHFLLQVGDLLLETLMDLLLDNSPDKWSEVHGHGLEVLVLLFLLVVILGLDWHLLLLGCRHDLSLLDGCLDRDLLLLHRDQLLLFLIGNHHWLSVSVWGLLPEHEKDDPVSELACGKRLSLQNLWIITFELDVVLQSFQNLWMNIVAIVVSQLFQEVGITHHSLSNLPCLLLSEGSKHGRHDHFHVHGWILE